MAECLLVASKPSVVRRAPRYAIIVSAVLIAINHGGAILGTDASIDRLLRMALIVTVPYAVSTASPVVALHELDQ